MKNKINKFLDKKITVGEAIGNIILVITFMITSMFIFIKLTTKNYDYMSENDKFGNSKICYEEKGNLYCVDSVKVKWYRY